MVTTANIVPTETATVNSMVMGPRAAVSVGASPCSLVNASNTRILILLSIGTVTLIEFARDGVTFDNVGLIAGQFILNPGDQLRVTYVVAPTVVSYSL